MVDNLIKYIYNLCKGNSFPEKKKMNTYFRSKRILCQDWRTDMVYKLPQSEKSASVDGVIWTEEEVKSEANI